MNGLLLVAVHRSTNVPHFVADPGEKGVLRCPERMGSDKIWWSEAHIAAAYRRRQISASERQERTVEVYKDTVGRYSRGLGAANSFSPLLAISLVPDQPGDFTLDNAAVAEFRAALPFERILAGASEPRMTGIGVGHRCLWAYGPCGPGTGWTGVYTDGSGCVALPLVPRGRSGSNGVGVMDSEVILYLAGALKYLALHARERAGTFGTALLDVRIQHTLSELWTSSDGIGPDRRMGTDTGDPAHGQAVAFLEDLADDGQPLAAVTAELAGSLFQQYGVAECRQLTRDGHIDLLTWGEQTGYARMWADTAKIPITARPSNAS
jgi:hypothetical protein